MPVDLASLLVEVGAATAEQIERALERQREAGGALDTALLELGIVDEPRLTDLLAESTGLPPAPSGDLEPDARARRVFPARVAERHGLAPFRLEGRDLELLARYPFDAAITDEISFMLSLHLVPHAAPEWRVIELMSRTYGVPMPPRLEALAAAARSSRDAAGADSALGSSEEGGSGLHGGGGHGSEQVEPPRAGMSPLGSAAHGMAADVNLSRQSPAQAAPADDQLWQDAPDRGPGASPAPARQAGGTTPASPSFLAHPSSEAGAESRPVAPRQPTPEGPLGARGASEEPLAAALEQAIESGVDATAAEEVRWRVENPRRWTREEVLAALEGARNRDELVSVALNYCCDFFEAAAVFAVTRDRVSGHDAIGWLNARERCRAMRVTLDRSGFFGTVIETGGPYLGPIAHDTENEAILAMMGREWPRIAFVYPVTVSQRIACILYADNGDAPVSPRRLGDLLLLEGALGRAFERILREGKQMPPIDRGHVSLDHPGASTPHPVEDAWGVTEPARVVQSLPAKPPLPDVVGPEPYEVAQPAQALAAHSRHDPSEIARLLRHTERGSPERARLIADLVALGPDSAAALRAAFPGPFDMPPEQREAVPIDQRGPVLQAMAQLGIVASPFLVELLSDPDAERRRTAALLLGRVGDPAGFLPLAERALDPDPRVAEAAVRALRDHRRHPEFRPVLERLRRALLADERDQPGRAARALAHLGDVDAIPLLIQSLELADTIRGPAHAALQTLTGRVFPPEAPMWAGWWKANRQTPRVDWLFAGLEEPDRQVRQTCAELLKIAGPPPSGWMSDAPGSIRHEAAKAWRSWWDANDYRI